MGFLSQINLVEILSSFIVLFVIIDVTGSIPIFLSLKSGDKNIKAGQACTVALLMFIAFFYAGDLLLELFSIDVASFAVAGSLVFWYFFPAVPVWQWIVFGVLVVIFGTYGDLFESLLKRTVQIKDSGNILPGHGGILDRFDSLLFAIPVIYIYLTFIKELA